MSQPQPQSNTTVTRRSALYGFAEHVWSPERSRWLLRPRWKPILTAVLSILVAIYIAAAGAFYALNRWQRGCEDTSFREMLLFVFPDRIPFTNTVWVPDFVETRIEAARESHRHKLANVLFNRAKTAMAAQDWRNFFHNVFSASTLDPRNMEARILSAQAFFALRRDDDALAALEEPLPLMLDKPEYVREFVRACFAKEQDARLIGVSKHFLKDPTLPPATRELLATALAGAHFFRGEFDAARAVIENEKLGRTREGFLLTVRMLWETGKRAEALAMLEPVAMASVNDPSLLGTLIDLKKEAGDIDGARSSASLYLIRASDKYQARVKLIELLENPADQSRRDETIASYRKEFEGKEAQTLLLAEYAADRGLVKLSEELMQEARKNKFPESPRFELLFIESHLAANRYEETVSLVDKVFVQAPEWLSKYRQVFDCLRMVAQMSMNREDMGEIGFRRLSETSNALPMPLMTTVAKKLVQVGRTDDAIRVIDLAYDRNARTLSALNNVVEVHLESGGGPGTPELLRKLLSYRRPTTAMLAKARRTLAGDAFLFEPGRDKLIADLDTLISGKPVLSDVPEKIPSKEKKFSEG